MAAAKDDKYWQVKTPAGKKARLSSKVIKTRKRFDGDDGRNCEMKMVNHYAEDAEACKCEKHFAVGEQMNRVTVMVHSDDRQAYYFCPEHTDEEINKAILGRLIFHEERDKNYVPRDYVRDPIKTAVYIKGQGFVPVD